MVQLAAEVYHHLKTIIKNKYGLDGIQQIHVRFPCAVGC